MRPGADSTGQAAGFRPLGVGWQSLANPASIGPGFEPADANDRQPLFVAQILAVVPISRAGCARLIDEIEQRRQRFLVPELELLVAARVDEPLILFVRHAEAIQIYRLDADEIAFDEFRVSVRRAAGRVRLFRKLAQQHASGRHERHAFVQLADRPHDVQLREMLFCFRPQQQCISASRQKLVDERIGAERGRIGLQSFEDGLLLSGLRAVALNMDISLFTGSWRRRVMVAITADLAQHQAQHGRAAAQ